MCLSRLQRVVAVREDGRVATVDLDGRHLEVSLLAYDGAPVGPGDWLVVQSGYALGTADPDDAALAAAALGSVREDR